MKVVILAGGRGTRLSEETHAIPKPMVRIGGRPIIWHIMSRYAAYGFDDFIVACGYKGEVLKEYFSRYRANESDIRVDLDTGSVELLSQPAKNWRVTLVDTGQDTKTGGRIKRLERFLDDTFMLTYGDGLADIPIDALIEHHRVQRATATVTAVHPLPRWGALSVEDERVVGFSEKPADPSSWVNGGYFVMEPEILDLLVDEPGLEQEPMETLAARRQLAAYRHDGFWMAMDTARDRDELNELWDRGDAPWTAR
ncbi:MAG: glucose-1-phosphate cytidylyltransferase [Nocardioidaceae bacterium]|nr:glucose-1-phosphate cytidylyltransferase [Nocardioidaceae bacterium]